MRLGKYAAIKRSFILIIGMCIAWAALAPAVPERPEGEMENSGMYRLYLHTMCGMSFF